ncbi:hypothetical protein P154DRAFT_13040 [Amniculicola lignicola CBS 123094]|uniref:Uncharacterized protein n=1 Tax=Amniculicola lignicola CBS 123094 TaxID=1392246 RepID=A0A6A5X4U0_9PLEO|nr:hypothetical protein P154DRAFT_13040 [Amniculicola lignicola CBS 123094]
MKAPHGWQETVIDAMREDYDAQHSSYLRSSPATGMVAQMKKEDLEQFDKGLLRWIRFSEVDDRQTKISEAYHKTFDWIFRHPPHNAWSNFSTWLISESEPLYWITGKPAAGKSTLMKFLHADPRTLQLLSHWAGAKKLIFCPFYFWNSGTNLQMSQEGMARTLLYKTLQQAPELWAILFPQHMEEYIAYGNPWHRPITWELLTDAFQRLVNGAGPNYRLFFFIDGLDEFDGDHQRLVSLIQGFISPHVKTCVSSRPWNVFQDNFRRRPSLRLEDITYGDIKYYVTSRFQSNVGFEDRRRETPYEARELIENIIRKASGVFLWVALVTDSLLEGLSDGDRLSELQARLDALPPDLETLFWKILTNLGDRHFKRTSQVLQIIQASVTQLDILTLSYADEEDPDLALKMPFGELPAEQADARAQNLCRRLNGSCKGLLEWRAPEGVPLAWAKVGYLHRTVKDYVERPDVWHKLLEITDESFDPFSRLCGALISVLKVKHRYPYQSLSTFWGYLWDHVTFAIEYAVRADPDCESGRQVRFLNELDSVAAKIASDQSQYKVGAHGHVRKGNIIHWSDGKGGSLRSTAFLHLAVLLRLTPYIRTTARSVRDKKVLNYALLIAVELSVPRSETELSYVRNFESCPSLKSLSKIPPLEIIQILLHHGADPNAKLNALSGWDSPPPWETFLAEFNDVSDQGCARKIGQMMLDHGALPTLVKQDVDKELYSFARQKKRASRMGGIMMFGTKIKSRMTGAKPSVT